MVRRTAASIILLTSPLCKTLASPTMAINPSMATSEIKKANERT